MILSAQSIMARCTGPIPMISPFMAEREVIRGKSAGLSSCSYDVRIASNLVLGVSAGDLMLSVVRDAKRRHDAAHEPALCDAYWKRLANSQPNRALANTIEDFAMPDDVAGFVVDKSSFARVFVTAFNTLLDPGFAGNLTLELVNLGNEEVVYKTGDPVCQIVFHQLDQPTDRPYRGKYLHQTAEPHPARFELPGGGYATATPRP